MRRSAFAIQTLFLAAFAARPLCAARPPFTAGDVWAWEWAADPRITADGLWVVYAQGWNDRGGNAVCSNLWIVSATGGPPRRLTEGAWRDSSPRWSPDGSRIAWIAERGGKAQIRVRARESSAEREVTAGESALLSLSWSADGEFLAFTARVPVREEPPAWAPAAILPRLRPRRADTVRLFVVPATKEGAPRAVPGDVGVSGEAAWMPDGRSLVAAGEDGRIWSFPLVGGSPRPLTAESGRAESPVPSPDGGRIAWLATGGGARQSYATRKLWVMNADGSRARILSGSLDRDAADPQWSSDSRTVYFLADDRGSTHVYAARNDGTVRQATTAPERLRGFSLADNGRAVTIRSAAAAAGEVYSLTVDRVSQPGVLAAPAEHLLAEREIGATEELQYDSGGHQVQAWLVKPPGFDASKKYPLLLDIRDDPRAMYGPDFNLRTQILAARGFVVLCVNPRGTPGYGEQFGNLLETRYPGDDYDDLMRGVDQAAARPYIDTARLAVTGGLLAAWTIGHTDRFRRAVARHPVADWAMNVALAPDGMHRALSWMRALPWENPDQYVRHSPIFFAGNFLTPTLVLAAHGDPEAEQLYFALQVRHVDSALVRTPAHATPADLILELETVLAWLDR